MWENVIDKVVNLFLIALFAAIVIIPLFFLFLIYKSIKKRVSIVESIVLFFRKNNTPQITRNNAHEYASGLIFGKLNSEIVYKKEYKQGHTLIVGEVGSEKTACFSIPSLLFWNGSAFVIDTEGEIEKNVHRSKTKVFEPGKGKYTYDILNRLKNTNNKIEEVKMISNLLIPLKFDKKDTSLITFARNLLSACILNWENLDFPIICQKIHTHSPKDLLSVLINEGNEGVNLFVNSLVDLKPDVLSSIYTEMAKQTIFFATDKDFMNSCIYTENSIVPEDLENGFDIFIKVTQDNLDMWQGFLNLIVSQFIKYFEKRSYEKTIPILFLLDEFLKLGKVEIILNALSSLRNKKINICIITQSLTQLDMIYGENKRKIIVSNCEYKLVFNTTDIDTQEYFSKLVGTQNVVNETKPIENDLSSTFVSKANTINKVVKLESKIKPEKFALLGNYVVLFTPDGIYKITKAPYYKDFKCLIELKEKKL